MKFSELLGRGVERDFEVGVVCEDSRLVRAGDVFVWDNRVGKGGEGFVAAALKAGARVVSDGDYAGVEQVEDAGVVLARWAEAKWPRQPEVMMGVTGTSGKTSVAWFARQLAGLAGRRAASVGTLGVMRGDEDADYTGYTSPTALKLHPILDGLAGEGVTHCALEVSSHALELRRVEGVRFKSAGLTNMTQDHLDFHGSIEAYHGAKLRFFSELLPAHGVAVVNVGRRENVPAAMLAKQRGIAVLSVGLGNAELVCEIVGASNRGLELRVKFDATPVEVVLPLIGGFQAENLAVALGLLVGGGMKWDAVKSGIGKVTGVPGRMEMVGRGVVVDYAHKPDALQRALESLKPLVQGKGKLRVVFGCGGNRDASKRPIMGRIASELADVVYVTDDNPRREDAGMVRKDVLAGCVGGAKVYEEGDRRKAMEMAMGEMGPDDVVLVAGKGHEDGQIVGDTVLPFDDRVVAREILGGK